MSWRFENETQATTSSKGTTANNSLYSNDRASASNPGSRLSVDRPQRGPYPTGSINQPQRSVIYKKKGKGCTYCTKYSIFLSNVFIFLVGVSILSVGLWAKTNLRKDKLTSFQDPVILTVIVLGSFIGGSALFGCCGAWLESRFLLTLFLVVLVLLLIAQLGVGIGSYVERSRIPTELDKLWDKASDNLRNYTQFEFSCCGFFNSTDREILPCPIVDNDKHEMVYSSCSTELSGTLSFVLHVLEITSIVIASILLFAIFTTSILMCILRQPSKGEYQAVATDSF